MTSEGFRPPPYPYDRLVPLRARADSLPGGVVDCSVGTPCDPPPPFVAAAMADPATARGYPPSIGTAAYREAAAAWMARRFGVVLPADQVAACIGTKEFVAGLPHWLRLRDPGRDTVLYPAVSYPSYAMGAELAGCRAVPVSVGPDGHLVLEAVAPDDAARALCLWVNSPGNPAGTLDDLDAAAEWGRAAGVPVISDECYAEFTWSGPPRTILEQGDAGVLAVHSLSKRSNFAGARVGFYAGDPELVHYLSEVRKHAGFLVPGPVQAAGALAWADDEHVADQRNIYLDRINVMVDGLSAAGIAATTPHGAFYLWVRAPGGDSWALADRLASAAGLLVSPGEFYGPAAADHVRIAMVQPIDRLRLSLERLASG